MWSGARVYVLHVRCHHGLTPAALLQVELFYWHGLIPYSAYTEWKTTGCDVANPNPTKECVALLTTITDMVGPFDPDNLCVGCCVSSARHARGCDGEWTAIARPHRSPTRVWL